MLEDEGFFTETDTVIQPPGDGIESEEDSEEEEDQDANHLKTQLVCRLLVKWKNALDWKTCSISMFSKIFSPYNHVLVELFRK